MGNGIALGLSSMSICFDFLSTNVEQLSNRSLYFYGPQFSLYKYIMSMSACKKSLTNLLFYIQKLYNLTDTALQCSGLHV